MTKRSELAQLERAAEVRRRFWAMVWDIRANSPDHAWHLAPVAASRLMMTDLEGNPREL